MLKTAPKTGNFAESTTKFVESETKFAESGTIYGIQNTNINICVSKFRLLWNPQM